MCNIVIYPYDETIKKTLQYINVEEYCVSGIVSPRGWGYCDDVLIVKNEKIKIVEDFSQIEFSYDSVCFVNSRYGLDFEKDILPIVFECKKRNMDMFICRDFSEEELEIIKIYISVEKLHILYEKSFEIQKESKIYEIDIPIIFVIDIFGEMDSQDIQLDVYNEFRKRNYDIKLVSSKRDMRLIKDVDIIPQMVTSTYGSNKEKIVRFNHYIKQIEIFYNPDLIIIGIPGNLIEISKEVLGDFGSSAYIISKSVSPDYVLCNIPYFPEFENKYDIIKEYIENRIESKIDACNVVAQYLELMESEEYGKIEYIRLSTKFIEKKIVKNGEIYFLQNKDEVSRIADDIISKFMSYAQMGLVQ